MGVVSQLEVFLLNYLFWICNEVMLLYLNSWYSSVLLPEFLWGADDVDRWCLY